MDAHWAKLRADGFYLGIVLLLNVYRLLGRRVFKLFTIPVIIYYFILNSAARKASMEYLQSLNNYYPDIGVKTGAVSSIRHFRAFADCLLDKLDAWSGQSVSGDVVFKGREIFLDLISQHKGALILCSHIGNLEITMALAEFEKEFRLNVLVHTRDTEKFNVILRKLNNHSNIRLIQVADINPATIILLNEKVSQGEFIAVVGDRVPVNEAGRKVLVPFLGRVAEFATGPYILAALLKCPVLTLFCTKRGDNRYHIEIELFGSRIVLAGRNKQAELSEYAAKFAGIMEGYCRQTPYQWFNFFPYWRGTGPG